MVTLGRAFQRGRASHERARLCPLDQAHTKTSRRTRRGLQGAESFSDKKPVIQYRIRAEIFLHVGCGGIYSTCILFISHDRDAANEKRLAWTEASMLIVVE